MRAFGLDVEFRLEVPGAAAGSAEMPPDLVLSLDARDRIAAEWSGPEDHPVWRTVIDGRPFVLWAGSAGDHLMRWGDAEFHLAPSADRLLCAVADPAEAAWQRQLMDTVLHTVALIRGGDALHASVVGVGGRAIGIVAASGGGKTTLASELVLRGGALVSDDVLFVRRDGAGFMAQPGPPLMNIPAERLEALGTGLSLVPLARFGDEAWVQVEQAAADELPLDSLWLLERADGLETAALRIPASPLPLMAHTLVMGNREDRDRYLFELLGDLVKAVPMYRLTAGLDAGPEMLADIVERT
jgi:hypothetical protein